MDEKSDLNNNKHENAKEQTVIAHIPESIVQDEEADSQYMKVAMTYKFENVGSFAYDKKVIARLHDHMDVKRYIEAMEMPASHPVYSKPELPLHIMHVLII